MLSAYLLVSHGSSDPRHQAGLSRLADIMRQHLDKSLCDELPTTPITPQVITGFRHPRASQGLGMASASWRSVNVPCYSGVLPTPVVGTASLEATPIPLAQQIEVFAKRAMAQGIRQVVIVPLFLLAGVHVKEDLPREIAKAQTLMPSRMRLLCAPYLGSQSSFKHFVASRLQATSADRCLLLAHGSRRSAGNRSVQQLGESLDADVAFWSVPPDLETQVIELMQQGYQQIAIAPYFLFPGSITDAITRRTEDLAERLSRLSLRLLAPLGTSAELGRAVAEVALSVSHSVAISSRERDRFFVTGGSITA